MKCGTVSYMTPVNMEVLQKQYINIKILVDLPVDEKIKEQTAVFLTHL